MSRPAVLSFCRTLIAPGLLVLLAACGGGSSTPKESGQQPTPSGPAQVVQSDDGSASLSIPDGALPSGVKLADIKVTRLADADAPMRIAGRAPFAAFRMEPNGTRFKTPVQLTVSGVPKGDGMASAFLISDGQAPTPLNVDATGRGTADEPKLVVTVPHFSTVVIGYDKATSTGAATGKPLFDLKLTGPSEVFVGIPFSVTAETRSLSDDYTSGPWESGTTYDVHLGQKTLFGSFTTDSVVVDTLAPAYNFAAPSSALLGTGGAYPVFGTFTCTGPFDAYINYKASLSIRKTFVPHGDTPSDSDATTEFVSLFTSILVHCRRLTLTADLQPPTTAYNIERDIRVPRDPTITYTWKGAISCGVFSSSTGTRKVTGGAVIFEQAGTRVEWTHPDAPRPEDAKQDLNGDGIPDFCPHSEVPNFSHPGTITVTVSDGKSMDAYCTYEGSLTGTGQCKPGKPPP